MRFFSLLIALTLAPAAPSYLRQHSTGSEHNSESTSLTNASPQELNPSRSQGTLAGPPKSYIAAVAQHTSVGVATTTSPLDVMESNLKSYEEIARLATASGAQIVVFPEWGLFGKGNPAKDREKMEDFCETIDDTSVSSPTTIVGQLSALAATYKVAITANVCEVIHQPSLSFPGDDKILYNTEVAFDSDGTLLAKYHKNHPFYTDTFDTPPEEEVVSFTTSFGVTFGLFVCYDLVHSTPEDELLAMGITQFPYSVSEPATLAGKEYFQHWTKKHKATLLASNLGNSGSGIFVKGDTVAMVDRGRTHSFAFGQVVV